LGGDLPQALRRKCALENSNYVVHALALEMAGEINAIRPVSDQSRTSGLLARAAQNRDRGAFADLFDEYSPRLKSFMMRKGASPELAEDLVQETMISVWTKAGLYDPAKGSVTTWIFTIARNLRIDRIRREGTVHLTELGDYDEASDEPGSDELLVRFQEQSLMTRALTTIPEEQKAVLLLSYVDDLPQSEIAQRLNIPIGTVKSRMRLAYKRLRKTLESNG
jgi:RNA polymerase sigma-70 factor (ECF subfamily)